MSCQACSSSRVLVAALCGAVAFCQGLSGAGVREARAQNADPQRKAAAEALFDDGKNLLEQGDFAAACQRLQQSQDIDPGVGTLLYLGECYARLGKLASAWAIFREASSAARASGQGERTRIAEERARELRPRLSQLALLVPANEPRGFELLLDGDVVFAGLYGVPFPVDAGPHQLLARAPGFEVWSSVVQVAGDAARQSLQVPVLTPSANLPAPGPAAFPPPAASVPGSADTGAAVPAAGGPAAQRTLAYWVGGGGLAVVGVGVVFGLQAKSKDDEAAEKYCLSEVCFDDEGEKLNQSARNWALAANVFYGVGAAAVVGAAVLYFTAGEEPAQAGALQLAPMLGSTPGVSVAGQF